MHINAYKYSRSTAKAAVMVGVQLVGRGHKFAEVDRRAPTRLAFWLRRWALISCVPRLTYIEVAGSLFTSLPPLLWECGGSHSVVLWYLVWVYRCLGVLPFYPPIRPGLPRRPAHTTAISVAVGGTIGILYVHPARSYARIYAFCKFVLFDCVLLSKATYNCGA